MAILCLRGAFRELWMWATAHEATGRNAAQQRILVALDRVISTAAHNRSAERMRLSSVIAVLRSARSREVSWSISTGGPRPLPLEVFTRYYELIQVLLEVAGMGRVTTFVGHPAERGRVEHRAESHT